MGHWFSVLGICGSTLRLRLEWPLPPGGTMYRGSRSVVRLVVLGSMLASVACARRETDDPNQLTFTTPDSAAATLAAALEKHDVTMLRRLLGPETEGLLGSGDSTADRKTREAFLERYRVRHQVVAGGPDDAILQVGEDQWPLPVPLLRRSGRWRFDGDAAAHELLARRIGANELRTIDVMRGYVD